MKLNVCIGVDYNIVFTGSKKKLKLYENEKLQKIVNESRMIYYTYNGKIWKHKFRQDGALPIILFKKIS